MDTYRRPNVAADAARALAQEHFAAPVAALTQLTGGEISQTFSFHVDGREWVLKLNHDVMDANFEKEAFIGREFASRELPIPRVLANGRWDTLHYIILEKAIGVPMNRLSSAEVEAAWPALLDTLAAVRSVDVGGYPGYGLFDGAGHGFFDSWRDNLEYVMQEEREDGFFGRWHSLFDTTFLERDLFDAVFAKMLDLLDAAPADRWLVHGNFGFGNLLVDGDRVTAVIDWIEAKFGDFVFDVAWLDFWQPGSGLAERARRDCSDRGVDLAGFDDRLLCYECYIALDAMRFYAKSDQEASYGFARARVRDLLGWV